METMKRRPLCKYDYLNVTSFGGKSEPRKVRESG